MSLPEVYKAMLSKLAESGLTDDDAAKLNIKPIIAQSVPSILPNAHAAGGFIIPYHDIHGKPTKFCRFRYLEFINGFAKLAGIKEQRYTQPVNTKPELYLSPLVEWLPITKDVSKRIFITEGENKSSCACKLGFITIGLGGVWNFRSSKQSQLLIPAFDLFDWTGREVIIAYDSDAIRNPSIIAAENALAKELTKRGAIVFILRLPDTSTTKKTGLDDYLVAHGAAAFRGLLTTSARSPWRTNAILHELSESVVLVNNPVQIVKFDEAPMQRLSRNDFMLKYASLDWDEIVPTANGQGTKVITHCVADEWIHWPCRPELARLVYKPGQERIISLLTAGKLEYELNEWPGWGCEPCKDPKALKLFLDLLKHLFKGCDPDDMKWLIQWLAYPIQHPGAKLFTSVGIHGREQGTGKSLIGYTMGAIYGENFAEIKQSDLHDTFTSWAYNKQFCLADDVTGTDKRREGDMWKKMVTQTTMTINIKYVPSFQRPDMMNTLFTTNHFGAFFLEDTDRRFFIHEVKVGPLPDSFYTEYDKVLKNGTLGPAVFDYLLNVDLTGLNPNAPARMTTAKANMISDAKSELGAWVYRLREDPDGTLALNGVRRIGDLFTSRELREIYDPSGGKTTSATAMGHELKAAGFRQVNDGRVVRTCRGVDRYYAVRNIDKWLHAEPHIITRHINQLYGEK